MKSGYLKWLEQQEYMAGTIITQMHRAGRVEEYHGDLDTHYAADRMASLIESLSYSRADERDARPNPSKIPFDGDIYNNLASYRNAIQRYLKFRDGGNVGIDTFAPILGATQKVATPPKTEVLDGVSALNAVLRRAGYASIAAAVAEHTVFLDPATVAQTRGEALFPAIRGERRKIVTLQDGTKVMRDDNVIPTSSFLWAAACIRGKDVQFNHVWTAAKNPKLYSALWNVCVTPSFLAKTTDGKNHPEVCAALQYRAYQLYGAHPGETGESPKCPAGYDQLLWGPMPDPVPDLEAAFRKHLATKPKHIAAIAARELGWLFNDWKPDTKIGG